MIFKIRINKLIFLLFALFSINGFSQPIANFSSNKTSGCGSLVVQFQDLSTGNPTGWLWNFGNGNTSILQNPSAFYSSPGTYTVVLTVTDGGSNSTETKTGFIRVFGNPVSSFSGGPLRVGCAPLIVDYTDNSVPGPSPSAPINTWLWSFGDGNSSNSQNPSNTYVTAGNFNVTLQVIDTNGCNSTFFINNYIQTTKPTASYTATPLFSCIAPVQVNFTNTSAGSGLTYSWDFGDGNSSTQTNPQNNYNLLGNYTPMLSVKDINDCVDTLKKVDYVVIQNMIADFTVNNTAVCAGTSVSFSNLTLGSTSWLWDFGDGTTSALQNPNHTYAAAGSYTITLTASNPSCSDQEIKTDFITIHPKPVIAFSADITTSCLVPLTVNFTNSTINGDTYTWVYGDGFTSTDVNPVHQHTYNAGGTYSVRLTAISPEGCSATLLKSSYIKIVPPVARYVADVTGGCAPLPVNLNGATSTANEAIVSWFWDFGDGNTSTTPTAENHIFAVEGVYPVSLTITTVSGCTNTFTNAIMAGNVPTADFTFDTSIACAGALVQFNDNSTGMTGAVPQWLWDMEIINGSGSTVMVAFLDTGVFDVQLTALNNGCPDVKILTDTMTIIGPVARFNFDQFCPGPSINPYEISFRDTSVMPDDWLWDFGDGNTSTSQDDVHIYAASGIYSVTLTVSNIGTGCTHFVTTPITITNPVASFTVPDSAGCFPFKPVITNTSQDAVSYKWNFGNGVSSTIANPTVTFANPGKYDVSLVVTDVRGCKDTLQLVEYFRSIGIYSGFSSDIKTGCVSLPVNFTDTTLADSTIVNWLWDFGDGTIDSIQNPTHTFLASGTFPVTLTVRDTNQCTSKSVITNIVPTFPVPAYSTATPEACKNQNISITNSSTGSGLTYLWDFGDGTTSSASSATVPHSYALSGPYAVKLILTDINGCMDSLKVDSFIVVQNPFANYTTNDTLGTCPPFPVTFSNTSTGLGASSTFLWNFGDAAGTSVIENPLYIYNIAGSFSVSLLVTTSIGCTDDTTIIDLVDIKGPNGVFSADTLFGCKPLTVTFTSISTNTSSYTWDFGGGDVAPFSPDSIITFVYDEGGIYTPQLEIYDDAGCAYTVPNTFGSITVNSVRFDSLMSDSAICRGESIVLGSSSQDILTQFTWIPDLYLSCNVCDTTITTPDSTITYILRAVSGQCADTDSVRITVHQLPEIVASLDTTICKGNSTSISASGGISYVWNPVDGLSCYDCSSPQATPDTNTTYIVIGKDGFCESTDSVKISVNLAAISDFTLDPLSGIIPLDVNFTNNSQFADAYLWNFGNDRTSVLQNPTVTYKDTGTYTITLVAYNISTGCHDTAYFLIPVDVISSMEAPNVFTPNGDGLNDMFTVKFNSAGIKEFKGLIFNRWGQVIATWDNANIGWNGKTDSNEIVPDGTYFYTINALGLDGKIFELRGSLTLIR